MNPVGRKYHKNLLVVQGSSFSAARLSGTNWFSAILLATPVLFFFITPVKTVPFCQLPSNKCVLVSNLPYFFLSF